MPIIKGFAELRLTDAEEAGGKGANLGEMAGAGLPVPPGFVLLRDAYLESMRAAGVDRELVKLHREAIAASGDETRLGELSNRCRDLVSRAGMTEAVRTELLEHYRRLGADVVVAVRSSATGEDGKDASFAGMNETLTNIAGDEDLLDAVRRCWMSLFGPRVIAYRASRGFTAEPAMAVVVQTMIASQRSGVAFTADPSTGARDHVVVEAALGQGEVVVSGLVQPDTYVLDKNGCKILDVRVGHQDFRIVRGPDGHDRTEDLDPALADARVLDDDELYRVAKLVVAVEAHYGCPQDTEWAIVDGVIWLVQARPITTLGSLLAYDRHWRFKWLLQGLAASLTASVAVSSGEVLIDKLGRRIEPDDARTHFCRMMNASVNAFVLAACLSTNFCNSAVLAVSTSRPNSI